MKTNKNNEPMVIKHGTRKVGGNWTILQVGNMRACLLHFEEPSEEYGINGGRISKLEIRDSNNHWLCNYDRGWDMKPQTKKATLALDTIVTLYN